MKEFREQKQVLRGDIILTDLSQGVASEQQGLRPCLVIQNDIGNRYSTTVSIVPLTSAMSKRPLPTHIKIEKGQFGLDKDSVILAESIRTVDKKRFKGKLGSVDANTLLKVENAIMINLGIAN